ncbi:MAG TPA: AsmA-like C-terminal region-containing protein [Xanthobacteraceae bacterium]|nr:AsmA-like C-terminal region-containing protein [Xanthobacteraceae bacterium]
MQTTLLGVAIAFIVALTAALIGPHFIDWNQFRPQFEAEATRVIGAPVRVGGDMRATILPTPSLQLQSVAVGSDDADLGRARADSLNVEFNLGSLMRGVWRATELTINGMALDFGLDWRGRIAWPAGIGGVNLGSLAIDRLNVTGRIALHDGASRTSLELEDVAFSGDVRALAGAIRGEGNASVHGVRYPFRITSSPAPDEDGTKLRLVLVPTGATPGLDLDGLLRFVASTPRFEGGLVVEKPAPAKAAGDARPAEKGPWRIAAKLTADPANARFEQLEASLGADGAVLKVAGNAEMRFGAEPRLAATLSARKIDADRLIATGSNGTAPPPSLLPALRDGAAALPLPPFPVAIAATAETVALGGRAVQDVTAELLGTPRQWTVEQLTALAPGAARVTLRDAKFQPGADARLSGKFDIAAEEPEVLGVWLRGSSDLAAKSQKPLRFSGRFEIDPARIAVEDLAAAVESDRLRGRLVFSGLGEKAKGGSSRLEAAFKADHLDLDATSAMIRAIGGEGLAMPDEAQVEVDIAHAVVAGQDVRPVALKLDYGPQAIRLDRLRFGAGSGVAVEGAGAFDRAAVTGQMNLSATASSLDRLATLLSPLAPKIAERVSAWPQGREGARLMLTMTLDKSARDKDRGEARAQLDIAAPHLAGSATLTAMPRIAAVIGADLDGLLPTDINFDARLTAERAQPLLALLGLDGVVAGGPGAAVLTASASGDPRKPMRVKAALSGTGLDADATGTAEPFADAPTAKVNLAVRHADIAPLLGQGGPLGLTLTSRVAVAKSEVKAEAIDGLIAGARIGGKLDWSAENASLDGDLAIDALNIPAVFAFMMAAPEERGAQASRLGRFQGWRGRVAFSAQRAMLPGGSELRPLNGVVRADGQSLMLEGLKGKIGGGELTFNFDTRQTPDGTLLNANLALAGVEGSALRYRALAMPEGKVGAQLTLASHGRTAADLLGALSGSGSLTLQSARLAGLAPQAFEKALTIGDAGPAIDEAKLRAVVDPALAAGILMVAKAEVPFNVKDGRLRAGPATLDGNGAQAIVTGGYDVAADQVDIRATLSSSTLENAATHPDLTMFVTGSPDAPSRSLDLSSFSAWLSLRAIDRETKRLDAIERGELPARAARPNAATPARQPPRPAAPVSPQPPAVGNSGSVAAPKPAPVIETAPKEAAKDVPKEAHSKADDNASSAPPKPAEPLSENAGTQVAPLPPPIEVLPAPGSASSPAGQHQVRPRGPLVLTP